MKEIAIAILMVAAACTAGSEVTSDPKAQEVVERTHRTTATFSLYSWNDVPDEGSIKDGWSAEFHKGHLHRMEAPQVRMVADCARMTGTRLIVSTGELLSDPSVAKAACGINTNFEIDSVEWLGRHTSAFGVVDRVRVVAADATRTYDVLESGALATATYEDPVGRPLVKNWAVAVLDNAPDDIFTKESLARSAVPLEFQKEPAP